MKNLSVIYVELFALHLRIVCVTKKKEKKAHSVIRASIICQVWIANIFYTKTHFGSYTRVSSQPGPTLTDRACSIRLVYRLGP